MRAVAAWTIIAAGFAGVGRAQPQQPAASERRERLQTALDEWRRSVTYPGASLGVVFADGSIVAVTSGVSDRVAATPLRRDDLMLAGSTGKTLFAALALRLVDEGKLDLAAPIAKYLGRRPWFGRIAHSQAITVRHLMTHTSGLVRYEMNPAFTAALRAQPDKVWTPEEEIAFLFDATPPFAPGEAWEYSDTNYIVLGMILEEITQSKAYDEIRRRFLAPLKLADVVPVTGRRVPGLIPGYAGPRDPLGLPDDVMPGGVFVINPQFEWAGGGFATSAADLARWGQALYAGPALSPKARALMVDAAVPARLGPETRYGLGVIVRATTPVGPTWGHSGFFPGYQSELLHVRDAGVTLALQVNSSAPRPPGSRGLLRFLYDAWGQTGG
jgi:D-alanyl-D-alanine carboxypeptidase